MHMKIKFFNQDIEKFIKNLNSATQAKVLRMLDLLEKFGNNLGMPYSKALSQGLFELRTGGKEKVRVMYVFHNNAVILLHAFIKKQSKISKQDMEIALARKKQLHNITHM